MLHLSVHFINLQSKNSKLSLLAYESATLNVDGFFEEVLPQLWPWLNSNIHHQNRFKAFKIVKNQNMYFCTYICIVVQILFSI